MNGPVTLAEEIENASQTLAPGKVATGMFKTSAKLGPRNRKLLGQIREQAEASFQTPSPKKRSRGRWGKPSRTLLIGTIEEEDVTPEALDFDTPEKVAEEVDGNTRGDARSYDESVEAVELETPEKNLKELGGVRMDMIPEDSKDDEPSDEELRDDEADDLVAGALADVEDGVADDPCGPEPQRR